jgi:general secretion pathway protein D
MTRLRRVSCWVSGGIAFLGLSVDPSALGWRGVPAAFAQTPEPTPADKKGAAGGAEDMPGARGPLPQSMDSIAKAVDTPYRPKPDSHRVKFNLEDADLAELVQHISGLTGKRFIYGSKVRKVSITVVSPEPVTLAEAYEAFLSILQANGLTVVPQGEFLKIVDSAGAAQSVPPLYSRAAPVPETDAYVTRLYRLKSVSATEVANLLGKFKSKEGDITVYEPSGLLIITDTGAHIRRLIRLIEEVDVGSASSRMWIEPIHYGDARDYAKQINDIYQLDKGAAGGGLVRVLADELTNSLIIVGSNDGYLRLLEFLKRVDTAPAAEGRIHVLQLQHAVAEELAQTLTRMLSGTASAAAAGRGSARAPQPAAAPAGAAGNAEGLFEGAVRVTADKATNSLVITSSSRDYAQLRMVIDSLDRERRQVFIEAVIMDLSAHRSNTLGLAYHGGATADLGGSDKSIILGGFNPIESIAGPTQLQALALGVRGPDLQGTEGRIPTLPPGVSIPAFGVALNAVATSSDSNVLSTPHIIAMDNTEAEINVGENIPLQTNAAGTNLSSLAPLLGGAAAGQATQGVGGLGALGALGALGSAPRQDVGTKIKLTPHINKNNQVRLEIQEEISEQGAGGPSGTLGTISITQRSAKTTVVVDDQQTVVIGGLMRDTKLVSHQKIPLLGDLPVLGFLFRNSTTQTVKANLLLILTPYVIESQDDLRKVFTRKMNERQEFLDRYFVFNSDWQPPRDYTRTNGLVEAIRKAFTDMAERHRLELEGKPSEAKAHEPTEPLDLPVDVGPAPKGGAAPAGAPAAPKAPATPRSRRQRSENDANTPPVTRRADVPLVINPGVRSVAAAPAAAAVERVE